MISAVSNASQVYTSNYKSSLEKETATVNSPSDKAELYNSRDFMGYLFVLMKDSLIFNGDIDDVLHKVSSNYTKVLEEIESKGYNEEEKFEKLAVLNCAFEMTVRSASNKDVFRNQSTAIMNYGYSKFLIENNVKDYDGVPYESKSKTIIANHDKNMELILGYRKKVDNYVNAFYEEFINGVKSSDFKEAYSKATELAKQKMNEQNISYKELNSFIKNDLYHIGDEYYWYTYNPLTNKTYKNN